MDPLRISDADRQAAVDLLSEQYAVGRLTRDEFDERSDAVWSAKTQGDLAPVFADLPRTPQQDEPAAAPASGRGAAPARPAAHRSCSRCRADGPDPPAVPAARWLLAWFVLSRRYGAHRPPWAGHHHQGAASPTESPRPTWRRPPRARPAWSGARLAPIAPTQGPGGRCAATARISTAMTPTTMSAIPM